MLAKRRFQYEDEIKANPQNYDSWFDYIRLEESVGDWVSHLLNHYFQSYLHIARK